MVLHHGHSSSVTGPGAGDAGTRAPRQDRSRRTLARMTSAARRLLAEQGVAAVTVQAVVAAAGASVGSFYARFSGKEDLLQYVQQEVWGDVMGWWSGALDSVPWGQLSLEESLDRAVGLLRESLAVLAPERRALETRAEGLAAEHAFRVSMRRSLTGRILARRDAIAHPEPEAAVELGFRAVHGALLDLADEIEREPDASSPDGPPPAARTRDELTRLLVAYLSGNRTHGPDRAGVDFFDVWG